MARKESFGGVNQERMHLASRFARLASGHVGIDHADGLVRTILDMSNRNRLEAAKKIVNHLEEGEFNEALFVLKIFGNNSGFFSGTEKKYLEELIESLAPPGEVDAGKDTAEQFGGMAPTDMNRFLNTQDKPNG